MKGNFRYLPQAVWVSSDNSKLEFFLERINIRFLKSELLAELKGLFDSVFSIQIIITCTASGYAI